VEPAITETSLPGDIIDSVTARIYELGGFSLRMGSATSEWLEVLQDGAHYTVGGDRSGTDKGGTVKSVKSTKGGLGWIAVGVGDYAPLSKQSDQPLSSFAEATVLNPGQDEFSASFVLPPYSKSGPVDIALYLKSDLTKPFIVFEDEFTYNKTTLTDSAIALLVGLGAAIIGLLAGGNSGGGGGGPCFIATAAYGTPMAAEIDVLRAFRDTYLLNNAFCSAFVDMYYHMSPPLADLIARSPLLAAIVRLMLAPVLGIAKMPLLSLLLVSIGAFFAVRRKRAKV